MKKKVFILNRLEQVFGKVVTYAGILIIIFGIINLNNSVLAIMLILAGAILTFSFWATLIDNERKRVKFHFLLFGFIRIGRWIKITGEENLSVELFSRKYITYKRINIPLNINKADYRIYLSHSSGKFRIPLQKFKTKKQAEDSMAYYGGLLGMVTYKTQNI